MNKLNFKKQPTQEEIENFIDFIEYNRSQRNQDKEFLMKQFEQGNIILYDNNIKITSLNMDELLEIKKVIDKVQNLAITSK